MDLLSEIAAGDVSGLTEKKLDQPIEVDVYRSKPGDFRVGTGNSPASGMFRISVKNGYPIKGELKKLGFRFKDGEWSKSRIRPVPSAFQSQKFIAMMKRQPSEEEMERAVKSVDELAKKHNADISAKNRSTLGAGPKERKLPKLDEPGGPKAFGKHVDRVQRVSERWKRYGVEVRHEGRGASMKVIFTGKGTYPLRELFKKNGFRWSKGQGWTIPQDAWNAIQDRFEPQAFKLLPKGQGKKFGAKVSMASLGARLSTYKRMKDDPETWDFMREKYPWLGTKRHEDLSEEEWGLIMAEDRMTTQGLEEAALGVSTSRLSPDAPDELLALAQGAGLPTGTRGPAGRHRASLGAPNLEVELRTQAMKAMGGGRGLLAEGHLTEEPAHRRSYHFGGDKKAASKFASYLKGKGLKKGVKGAYEGPIKDFKGEFRVDVKLDRIKSVHDRGDQFTQAERGGAVRVSDNIQGQGPGKDVWTKGEGKPKKEAVEGQSTASLEESAPADPLSFIMGRDLRQDIFRNQESGYVPSAPVLGNRERHRQKDEIDALGRKKWSHNYVSEWDGNKQLWVSHRMASKSSGEFSQEMREFAKELKKAGYKVKTSAAKGTPALIDTMYALFDQTRIKKAERGHKKYVDAMRAGGATRMKESVDALVPGLIEHRPMEAPSIESLVESVKPVISDELEERKQKADYSRGGPGRSSELSWGKGPKPGKAEKRAAARGERHSKKAHIDKQMKGEDLGSLALDSLLGEAKSGRGGIKQVMTTKSWDGYHVSLHKKDAAKLKSDKEAQALLQRPFDFQHQAHDAAQRMFPNATVSM